MPFRLPIVMFLQENICVDDGERKHLTSRRKRQFERDLSWDWKFYLSAKESESARLLDRSVLRFSPATSQNETSAAEDAEYSDAFAEPPDLAGGGLAAYRGFQSYPPAFQAKRAGEPRSNKQMNHEKVLIVEDEENERSGLAELVTSWGYRVETAKDGAEGLEKATQWSPSMVITDLKMPRMGGIELLERLAEQAQTMA